MKHAILRRSYVDCSCGSSVDFVHRVIRRDPEDFMQRRRYVAPQEESAPGPDGLPYSVYRLSTSSSRSNSARPSFFYGLGHMHGGSDSTNFTHSQSSRSTHVACIVVCMLIFNLRRVLDFVFGTMKHSCHSAVSLSIADGRIDFSTASVTNPATAIDFSAASAATFVASIDVSVTNFAVSSKNCLPISLVHRDALLLQVSLEQTFPAPHLHPVCDRRLRLFILRPHFAVNILLAVETLLVAPCHVL